MKKVKPPICPYCGNPSLLVGGEVIYPHRPDLHYKKFYSCAPCDAYVGCHDPNPRLHMTGIEPLGRLANAELRKAKSAAHSAFDPLWRGGAGRAVVMKRTQAYEWLAAKLGRSVLDMHIGDLDVEDCKRVVIYCIEYRNGKR